jgi:hypothetical protein
MIWPFTHKSPAKPSRDEAGRFTSDHQRKVRQVAQQLRDQMPGRTWRHGL